MNIWIKRSSYTEYMKRILGIYKQPIRRGPFKVIRKDSFSLYGETVAYDIGGMYLYGSEVEHKP